MIGHILDEMNALTAKRPAVGSSETTIIQCPYEIQRNIFLWDMPGLGGNQ